MQQFSIREVERLSGIKAHTLRVWEQRYGIVQPARNGGKHRFYSNDELKKILKIVYLYQNGYKISEIARLPEKEMSRLVGSGNRIDEVKRASMLKLIEAVVDFDELGFSQALDKLTNQVGFKTAMIEVLFPLLNRLGIMWVTDSIVPGQEHFASNIILHKIIFEIERLGHSSGNGNNLVLILGPKGEYHEIGLLFLNYLLRKNGCRTVYLGINTDNEVAKEFMMRYNPSHILIHPVSNLQPDDLMDWMAKLHTMSPLSTIVVSGPLVGQLHHATLHENFMVLKNDGEIRRFISEMALSINGLQQMDLNAR